MTYAVLVEHLRAAAGEYHQVAGGLGRPVEITQVAPESFGHVELTAWVEAVADQCHKASRALYDGATGLADSLGAAASHYEATDEQVGAAFRNPFSRSPLGSPAPWSAAGGGS